METGKQAEWLIEIQDNCDWLREYRSRRRVFMLLSMAAKDRGAEFAVFKSGLRRSISTFATSQARGR